jgi:hypothetical protein
MASQAEMTSMVETKSLTDQPPVMSSELSDTAASTATEPPPPPPPSQPEKTGIVSQEKRDWGPIALAVGHSLCAFLIGLVSEI